MLREFLILVLAILLIWNIYMYFEFPETRIKSSVDNKVYTVKKIYDNPSEAADILARLNAINKQVIEHMLKKYEGTALEPNVRFMASNYNGDVMHEHTPRSTINTSYVLGKGDEIRLCLRDKKTGKFFEMNTLIFVNLHELAHLFDFKFGHERVFWDGFRVILQNAVELKLYNPVDYRKHAAKYCGMHITDNPYF